MNNPSQVADNAMTFGQLTVSVVRAGMHQTSSRVPHLELTDAVAKTVGFILVIGTGESDAADMSKQMRNWHLSATGQACALINFDETPELVRANIRGFLRDLAEERMKGLGMLTTAA